MYTYGCIHILKQQTSISHHCRPYYDIISIYSQGQDMSADHYNWTLLVYG